MRRLTSTAVISLIVAGFATPTMLSSAYAKDYYTRKRINGRWIQGYFPKKYAQSAVALREVQPPVQPLVVPEPARTATMSSIFPIKLGLHFSPETPPASAQAGSQSVSGAQPGAEQYEVTTGSTTKTYSARERRAESRELRRSMAVLREAKRREASSRAVQKRERTGSQITRLETHGYERIERHANSAALRSGDIAPATSTVSTETSIRTRSQLLAEALKAKAQALASGVIANVNEPLPARKAEPVSVTYDYRTGIKTVAYASGELNEEPFNLAALRSLSAARGMQ
jgi:hypothetical protein